jgi:hypothetical protein
MAEGQYHWAASRKTALVLCVAGVFFAIILVTACRPTRSVQVVPEKEVPSVKSTDLKQTSVVATLDDPVPPHRNVIWCATFQMAWDKLKRDVIKEPIKIVGAEALAERLNQNEFPPTNIESESFYVAAGFVKNGIIEEVQRQMARRFPSESIPPFDPRYKTLPKAFLGYGFLSVSVPFKYPFYASKNPFDFTDSNGTRSNVTSFDAIATAPDPDLEKMRGQVEILSGGFVDLFGFRGFAVDLCKDSMPYQVVLARIAQQEDTLGAKVASVEKRIADFKNNPDYEELRSLRHVDSLIVPDVLYKLTHEYRELVDHGIGNRAFSDCFIFEAMQMVDFRLSRTGVILKSEARMGGAGAGSDIPPRDFRFDKPFLIYVKKRQADAKPFFVMWVDNAELMRSFPATLPSSNP